MEFVNMLVQGIMDAIEEFFSSLTAPSTKFTFNAFVYSVLFLVASIGFEMFGLPCFVSWQESLTCVVLLGVIVLIDTSVRGNIKSGIGKLKGLTSKFQYTGEEPDEEELEVNEDGTGE